MITAESLGDDLITIRVFDGFDALMCLYVLYRFEELDDEI